MKYDPSYDPEFRTMHITVGRSRIIPESLAREEKHSQLLRERYAISEAKDNYLSPSAVNTWLNCRMKFYYRYVCGMPEEEKLDREIDQRRFGNILHDVMKNLYEPLLGAERLSERIKMIMADHEHIQKAVREAASR